MNQAFVAIDKEQAAMYRWIRDVHLDGAALTEICGQRPVGGWDSLRPEHIEQKLREAFHQHEAQTAGPKVAAAAQLRVGILPSSLGRALALYTDAAVEAAVFEEGLDGVTLRDKDLALTEAFRDLVDEILKLQR